MGGFEEKVRGVLSDTMNLPSDFLSMIPQYVAQNPVPLARVSGTRIAHGTNTASPSTAGTSFAAGVDILTSPLPFTADGKTDYFIKVSAPNWRNSLGGANNVLSVNLDGNDLGILGILTGAGNGFSDPLIVEGFLTKPAAGSHTLNVRLWVLAASTATIDAGAGGAGVRVPIFVSLEVA